MEMNKDVSHADDQGRSIDSDRSRYFTTNLGANYLLPSDEAERERLQAQHEVLRKEVFHSLVPRSVTLQNGDRVLDSGTGSGAWVVDVAAEFPSANIFAFDVEGNLFPPTPPTNATFSVNSVLSLPAEWEGAFTFVHQRLLLSALGMEEWKTGLAELYRVLKPGGAIRLEETGMIVLLPDVTKYEEELPHTWRLWNMLITMYKARGRSITIFEKIPQLLKDTGFADVKIEVSVMRCGPGAEWEGGRNNFLSVFRGFREPLLQLNLIRAQDYENLLSKIDVEWQNNAVGWQFYGFTAVRPV